MDKLYQQLITVPLLLQIIVYTFIATAAILLVILIIKRKDKHISDKLENCFVITFSAGLLLFLIIISYALALAPKLHPYSVTKQNNHIILKSNSAFLKSAKLSIEKELKDGYLVEYNSNYYKIKKSDITD
jgi:hypothetical protein